MYFMLAFGNGRKTINNKPSLLEQLEPVKEVEFSARHDIY